MVSHQWTVGRQGGVRSKRCAGQLLWSCSFQIWLPKVPHLLGTRQPYLSNNLKCQYRLKTQNLDCPDTSQTDSNPSPLCPVVFLSCMFLNSFSALSLPKTCSSYNTIQRSTAKLYICTPKYVLRFFFYYLYKIAKTPTCSLLSAVQRMVGYYRHLSPRDRSMSALWYRALCEGDT